MVTVEKEVYRAAVELYIDVYSRIMQSPPLNLTNEANRALMQSCVREAAEMADMVIEEVRTHGSLAAAKARET